MAFPLTELVVLLASAAQETLVVLYTRGITKGRIGLVMLMTAALSLLGSLGIIFVMEDSRNIIAAMVGHSIGVPLGMVIPLKNAGKSSQEVL